MVYKPPNHIGFSVALAVSALTMGQNAMAQSRGELLYTTHCIACHTTEMHWRDKHTVHDRASLQTEVRRWQDTAALGWSESDIVDVSRYLNESIYRFGQKSDPALSLPSSSMHHPQTQPAPAPTPLPRRQQ